jgi:[ribosomal protein S18]-alanine N-acetyltransferase
MAIAASPVRVRQMTIDDIPLVSEIERESFPTTWPQAAYRRELQSNTMARYLVVADTAPRLPSNSASSEDAAHGLTGIVGGVRRIFAGGRPQEDDEDRRLVAFLGLWFLLEECHIVTVAVRQAYRGRGLGELLVITSVELATRNNLELLTLECRVSNTVAQKLYDKYGFAIVGRRKRYYSDNNEDALIMTTPPIQTPAYQENFARLRAAHHDRWGAPQIAHPEL